MFFNSKLKIAVMLLREKSESRNFNYLIIQNSILALNNLRHQQNFSCNKRGFMAIYSIVTSNTYNILWYFIIFQALSGGILCTKK